jgi:ubiquitin C-terminal hydrolase
MNKGIIGLKNRGNTCYLNTSIQCLNNLELLTNYFLENKHLEDIDKSFDKNQIAKEYSKLIHAIWSNNVAIEPKSFHIIIQKYVEQFYGCDQQDSQESLSLIIDYLHESLKYSVNMTYTGTSQNEIDDLMIKSIVNYSKELNNKYSIIAELFFGQYINKITTKEEEKVLSTTFEKFNNLSISIYGTTLYDCLGKFFEKELLEDKYYDENTKEYNIVYREMKLMKVPKYLIIMLKRYNNYQKKSNNPISFPINNLDLTAYCEGYDNLECSLRLNSIGCHKGILNGGHYYAICRYHDKWYKFDDETVDEYNINENNNKQIIFKEAYILIYERID